MHRIWHVIRACALGLTIALTAAACEQAERPRQRTVTVFIDDSLSGTSQVERWLDQFERVVATVQPCERLVVFAITDRTGDGAPLFDRLVPCGGGVSRDVRAREELLRLRSQSLEAARAALEDARHSSTTAIFEGFRLIPTDVPVDVYVLSDALHDRAPIDLAGRVITDPAALARQIVGAFALEEIALRDARFHFLLDDPRRDAPPPVNSRAALRRVYAAVIASFGDARIVQFDAATPGGTR